ncbi:hypothetical protein [Candidatus Binatus sp.]|uniref:hypothetical protein n=1 Tax=Candidatus Binatus sp. TaxID=2811406 RepID=UPI002B48FF5C|nr:hypothetical protein [Candidatus Binatus sp.]
MSASFGTIFDHPAIIQTGGPPTASAYRECHTRASISRCLSSNISWKGSASLNYLDATALTEQARQSSQLKNGQNREINEAILPTRDFRSLLLLTISSRKTNDR